MEETGETMADIAQRGGFPRQTLSALMHRDGPKSIPRQATLVKLAAGLQMDLDIVQRSAARAAASAGVPLATDDDTRLDALIVYARKLDDSRLRALVTTARALSRVE